MQDDIFEGGIIRLDDYSEELYFSDDCLPSDIQPAISASLAMDVFNHSPARALWQARADKHEYKKNLVIGTVAHSVILQQKGWDENIAVMPGDYKDWRTKAARAWRDTKLAEGKNPVKQDEMEMIWQMRKAWTQSKLAKLLTVSGQSEVSLFWRCPETFCICKVRWDFLPDNKMLLKGYPAVDYKTTASLADWTNKSVRNNNLLIRAALYYESLLELTGKPCDIAYATQEKEPPYEVVVHFLKLSGKKPVPDHIDIMETARAQLKPVKVMMKECMDSGSYPKRKELVGFGIHPSLLRAEKERVMAPVSDQEFMK